MRSASLAIVLALAGCDSGTGGPAASSDAARGSGRDVAEIGVDSAVDAPSDLDGAGVRAGDAPADSVSTDATDSSLRVDVVVDDGFARPDARGPDAEVGGPIPFVAEGRDGCFAWTIEAESLVWDLKLADILVSYEVSNTCGRALDFAVDHLNDFFPLAIHENGLLWMYVGKCPGGGGFFTWTFAAAVGEDLEGVRTGAPWTADRHELLLEECGVTFDREAEYTLVGYANRPLEGGTTRSVLYPLTEPIPITIND